MVVVGLAHALELTPWSWRFQARHQSADRAKVEVGIAPEDGLERLEMVRLDGMHQPLVERVQLRSRAEGAVPHVAPGAAGDLRDLGRLERARPTAVELA